MTAVRPTMVQGFVKQLEGKGLSPGSIKAIYHVTTAVFGAALAGSGLRIGELLGLEVSDVDFLRREIRVQRQRDQTGKLPVKSKSSRRTVPVGQVVVERWRPISRRIRAPAR